MSQEDPYRVKFKDIRVRPPKDETSRAKAKETRTCEHQGCDLAGEHKAPKPGAPAHETHWFCQRHAAEYNRAWNFFDSMTEEEMTAFNASAAYGHRQTWRFGQGPVGGKAKLRSGDPRIWAGIDSMTTGKKARIKDPRKPKRTRLQARALSELDLPESADAKEIRERYSDYVKRFHPDANGGDRSSEHKLARVLRAFKTLKAAGLTQDGAAPPQ